MGVEVAAIAIGTVVAGAVGALAADSANRQNSQNVADTNATNMAINQQQLQFQQDQYEDAKQYNTPLNQRLRYEQAGINPYLAMSNISSGNAQSMTAPSQLGAQAAHVNPVTNVADMFEQLGHTPQRALELQQMHEQITGKQIVNEQNMIDLSFKTAEKLAGLEKTKAEVESILSSSKLSQSQREVKQKELAQLDEQIFFWKTKNKYLDEMFRANTDEAKQNALLRQQQVQGQYLNNTYQNMVNQAYPAMNKATLQQIMAAAADSFAQADLHRNMSKTEVENCANKVTEGQIMKLNKQNIPVSNDLHNALLRANEEAIRQSMFWQNDENSSLGHQIGSGLGAVFGFGLGSLGSSRSVVKGFGR